MSTAFQPNHPEVGDHPGVYRGAPRESDTALWTSGRSGAAQGIALFLPLGIPTKPPDREPVFYVVRSAGSLSWSRSLSADTRVRFRWTCRPLVVRQQRDADQHLQRHRLAIELSRLEYPMSQRCQNRRIESRVWTLPHRDAL